MDTSFAKAIELTTELLTKSGLALAKARATAKAIVAADVWGIPSHGLMRLPFYLQRMAKGGINPSAQMRAIATAPSAASLDGEGGMGHWQLSEAALLGSTMAKKTGISLVSISNSNHCGSLGNYVFPALGKGQLPIVFSNGPSVMPAFGGKKAMLSTSPLAAGIPASPVPIVIDMATSSVARGKIASAAQEGESIPEGWAFDSEGNPTTDARIALSGMLAPLGGAKGFALALLVESMSAGISGGTAASHVPDMFNSDDDARCQMISHSIITIDPSLLMGEESMKAFDQLALDVLDSGGRIPGGRRKNPDEMSGEFLSIAENVQAGLDTWCDQLCVEKF